MTEPENLEDSALALSQTRVLALRAASVAERALSELAADGGGTVILTKGCPLAASLEGLVPQPVLRATSFDELKSHGRARDLDLVIVGSDFTSAFLRARIEEIEDRIPSLAISVPDALACPIRHHDDTEPLYVPEGIDAAEVVRVLHFGNFVLGLPSLSHDSHGQFLLHWPRGFPLAASLTELLSRLGRMRALLRQARLDHARATTTGKGQILLARSAEDWRGGLHSWAIESATVEETNDADLTGQIDMRPDLDVVVIGGCICDRREAMTAALQRAAERGIPTIVPADCHWPLAPFDMFTAPAILTDYWLTIDGHDPHMLWRALPAALQERRAWLHSQGKPYDHLPRPDPLPPE